MSMRVAIGDVCCVACAEIIVPSLISVRPSPVRFNNQVFDLAHYILGLAMCKSISICKMLTVCFWLFLVTKKSDNLYLGINLKRNFWRGPSPQWGGEYPLWALTQTATTLALKAPRFSCPDLYSENVGNPILASLMLFLLMRYAPYPYATKKQ